MKSVWEAAQENGVANHQLRTMIKTKTGPLLIAKYHYEYSGKNTGTQACEFLGEYAAAPNLAKHQIHEQVD